MSQITMSDLLRADGTFDYQRYRTAADNWSKYGRTANINLFEQVNTAETKLQRVDTVLKDKVSISQEGMEKMREMQKNRVKIEDVEYIDPFEYAHSMTGMVTYSARLGEVSQEVSKSYHQSEGAQDLAGKVTVLGKAYSILREEIEARYDDPEYKPSIVVEADGATAHLMTKEEEIAMLDEAYEAHAEFAASSAKVMAEIAEKFGGDSRYSGLGDEIHDKVKETYMAAKEEENLQKLKEKVDSIQDYKLNLPVNSYWNSLLSDLFHSAGDAIRNEMRPKGV